MSSMLGSGYEKDINIMTGGGHGDLTPYLLSMMNQKDGGFGGNGLLLLIAILFLRGGFGGACGLGGSPAATGALLANSQSQDFMNLLSAISGVDKSICASTTTTRAAIDSANDRQSASAGLQFASTNANIAETKAGLSVVGDKVTNGFFAIQREGDQNTNSIKDALNAQICCLKSGIDNGFTNVSNNLQTISSNIVQNQNNLMGAVKDVSCQVATGNREILCAIANAEKDSQNRQQAAVIASQEARLNRYELLEQLRCQYTGNNGNSPK